MSAHSRDAALRRLHLLNRWAAAAAVILTVAFSVVVAHAFPGHTIGKTPSRRSPARAAKHARHRRERQRFPNPFPSDDSTTAAPTTQTPATSAPSTAPTDPQAQTQNQASAAPAPAAAAPTPAPTPAPSQPAPVVSGGS